ncbi:MAG: hypothetical protein F4Y08_05025 [Caldilineaceae bacterium SB0662_bin_9]|uniref:Uncharacterized protein n=1 Tax=Caldilineaceae bacterium SB0662_bin_9 TaxID=2605258 RepID=A0A6B1DQQ3_9CHLR|nr:hypothetical protein [Rhodospirillales bacterium]MYD89688.1 hypothetical protein [Caldilineaceae bacterium SB0662_bin_9]
MTGEGAPAWAYKPTRLDRITAWPFEGGPLRVVGFMVLLLAFVVVLSLPGERYQARQRAALVALCANAPATSDGRRGDHHAGTVVDRPTAAGYWGDNDGPNRPLGQVVFVQVDGRAAPIGVRGLPGNLPAGTPLRFCAAADGARLYGEPSGPFDAVMWLRDGSP